MSPRFRPQSSAYDHAGTRFNGRACAPGRQSGILPTTTIQLLGTDGGVGHAITIVGDWIFDATLERALPLTRESLDACCSSDHGRVAFRSVKRAVRMQPSAKRQKPNPPQHRLFIKQVIINGFKTYKDQTPLPVDFHMGSNIVVGK